MKKLIFWAVDCQKDFINSDGALYVQGAESIKPNLLKLTDFARKHDIVVVNTRDSHIKDDLELSDTPDFIETFPPHCMEGTKGRDFIKETWSAEGNTSVIFNTCSSQSINLDSRNFIINKNMFNVFEGNPHTDNFLKLINPDIVVVYGVAGDYCVNYAIDGLIKKGCYVIAVLDAIKSIKEVPLGKWAKLGIQTTLTEQIIKELKDENKEIK